MIKLIVNEHYKLSKLKRNIVLLLISISVLLIIYYNRKSEALSIYKTIYNFIPFIGIGVLMLYGNIVSSEYQNATFKHYFNKPCLRWKILLSKILYSFMSILLITTYLIVLYFIFIIIFSKFDNIIFDELIKTYIHSIPLYFIVMFCISISILSRSSSISLTVSILFFLMSGIIFQIFLGLDYTFMEYSFLPYLDYSYFLDKEYVLSLNEGFNLHLNEYLGLLILLFNIFILYLFSNAIFVKKDI